MHDFAFLDGRRNRLRPGDELANRYLGAMLAVASSYWRGVQCHSAVRGQEWPYPNSPVSSPSVRPNS